MKTWCLILFVFGWANLPLHAQAPFSPAAEKMANQMLDGSVIGDNLECHVIQQKPFLDFYFRFELGYIVSCPYRQFGGEAARLVAVVRVKPLAGKPVILGEVFNVPAMPPQMREKVDIRRFKGELEFSGAVGAGEGEYEIELLVGDDRNRYYRKSWKADAARSGAEKKADVLLRPYQVVPLLNLSAAATATPSTRRLHVSVLLNAAPLFPFGRKLRAWDRAFLQGSVSTLIRLVPEASVSLVAFNLDQQKEVFRTAALSNEGMNQLGLSLRQLELGTISYQTLQDQNGWADLLRRMLHDTTAASPSDAVIFVGPRMRLADRIPREMLNCSGEKQPKIFYLQYVPFIANQYPDSIDHLTRDCKGRVLGFHTPGEFGAAIQKIRESLLNGRG